MQVELDKRIDKLMEKFLRGHLAERMNNVPIANNQFGTDGRTDGEETYGGDGRQPVQDSREVQRNDQRDIRR
jgi:hypothetical protein